MCRLSPRRRRDFGLPCARRFGGRTRITPAGNLNRAILLLAIPMVLEMVLESLFAVVDMFWVAHAGSGRGGDGGADGIAADAGVRGRHGAEPFDHGDGGAADRRKRSRGRGGAGVQAIFLGLTMSLSDRRAVLHFRPGPAAADGRVARHCRHGNAGTRGSRWAASGAVVLLFLNNAIFRGAGDAAIAMRLLWVSNIINLVLDPCLIFGLGPFPQLGVTGAALATFTGRSIGVLYQFYRLMRGTERIRVLVRQIRLNLRKCCGGCCACRSTGIVQFAIANDELDRAGAHRRHFRRGGAGRLHDRDSHCDFRDFAVVGAEQCGGHAGGAESGREAAGTRGAGGLADGRLQHGVSGGAGGVLLHFCRPGDSDICERSGSGSDCGRRCCAR